MRFPSNPITNRGFIKWSFVLYAIFFMVVMLILWTFQPRYLWLYDSKGKLYFSWMQLVIAANTVAYVGSLIFLWLTFDVAGYCVEVLDKADIN